MCGRVALYTPPAALAAFLRATLDPALAEPPAPSWNVGPQRTLFGAHLVDGQRILAPYRWGLVPRWATRTDTAARTINARCETIREKPSYREAYREHPLVLVVDGFYEWEVLPGRTKQPHYFSRADGAPMIFAGLFERSPLVPEPTCTVITSEPGPDIDGLHDRMPVVLDPRDVDEWLSAPPDARYHLLAPAPAGTIVHHPVDPRVGSVRHDGPELIADVPRRSLF